VRRSSGRKWGHLESPASLGCCLEVPDMPPVQPPSPPSPAQPCAPFSPPPTAKPHRRPAQRAPHQVREKSGDEGDGEEATDGTHAQGEGLHSFAQELGRQLCGRIDDMEGSLERSFERMLESTLARVLCAEGLEPRAAPGRAGAGPPEEQAKHVRSTWLLGLHGSPPMPTCRPGGRGESVCRLTARTQCTPGLSDCRLEMKVPGDSGAQSLAIARADSPQSSTTAACGLQLEQPGVAYGQFADAPQRMMSVRSVGGPGRGSLAVPEKPSERSKSTVRKSNSARLETIFRNSGMSAHKPVFPDADAMKEKLKAAIGKREYRASDYYSDTGIAQCIAKSALFENVCLLVIGVNTVWIAIDTNFNKAAFILDADPVFSMAENLFCTFFFLEWLVRFLAFRHKRDCLRDRWFVFDSSLMSMMVIETWVVPLVFVLARSGNETLEAGSDVGVWRLTTLRVLRLLRLARMARVVRLMRATPELMVLVKAMGIAMRSVFFTLVILMALIYVFAIAFMQMLEGTPIGERDFSDVLVSMNTLLVFGALPDQKQLIDGVGAEHVLYRLAMIAYLCLATLTMMNMLVGILVEVINVTSAVEKERLLINTVTAELRRTLSLHGLGTEGDALISRDEFGDFLAKPYALRALKDIGVDAVGLVDFADFIFADAQDITFAHFMDTILQLRGSNVATVKDIVDLRKFVTLALHRLDLQNDHRHMSAFGMDADLQRVVQKRGGGGGGNDEED